ncbi:MAG TPA: SDR family NAD(P)-dependent oxidoreductase, partial [Microlunatus sp.]|nr:SDR family NAD(P)-dependent oxidoreductase [Microlunatus sp.]
MSVALITGGSAGFGLALLEALDEQGWTIITDGRDADRLAEVEGSGVVRVPGDIADPTHRAALVAEVE